MHTSHWHADPSTAQRRLRPGPKLPGSVTPVPYRDPETRRPLIHPGPLRQQILTALAGGPQSKPELHRTLLLGEHVIYRQLKILRAQGVVKVVGRRLIARKWALTSWQPPRDASTPAPKLRPVLAPKAPAEKPATCSWWAQPFATREAFYVAHRDRSRDKGWVRENYKPADGSVS